MSVGSAMVGAAMGSAYGMMMERGPAGKAAPGI